KTKLSRNVAVGIVYLVFFILLVAIPSSLTPVVVKQVSNLTATLDFEEIEIELRDFLDRPLLIGNLHIPVDNFLGGTTEILNEATTTIGTGIISGIAGFSTNIVWVILTLILVYYLLKDSYRLIEWFVWHVPDEYQPHAHNLIKEIDGVWGSFLRGQLVLMFVVGVLSWLGALIVGIPGAVVLGLIAGIFDIIPSLGPTLAAVIAMAVAFLQGSSYLPVSNGFLTLIILGIFIGIQQAENIWFRPAVLGGRLHLHPAFIIAGVFGSLALFGVLAALIVVPVMGTIGVLGRYSYSMFFGLEPFPDKSSNQDVVTQSVEKEQA
ncbi:MAG: hypothetical protein B6242_04055, partial [Anaerolineaceae bacterium 4572_78]